MHKTDVDGVFKSSHGVMIIDRPDNYVSLHAKALYELDQKNRINNLENKVTGMELMLKQILEKVSDGKT